MKCDVGGHKRRKLLTLLAAFADAGIEDPSIRELRTRCNFTTPQTITLLNCLIRDGFVTVEWRASDGGRNRYTLTLPV